MTRSTGYLRRGASARQNPSASTATNGDESYDDLAHEKPVGSSYREAVDGRMIGLFAAGLLLGVALGAGSALLLTPLSGEETRELIGQRARDFGGDVSHRWENLRDDVHWMGRRGRKRISRALTRGRWAAEDVVARGRR